MQFKGADLLSTEQFTRADIEQVMRVAKQFEKTAFEKKQLNLLKGKLLASLFYEPSTRTRFSFETAMKRLGGDVITAVGPEYSSLQKGETLWDTAQVTQSYADLIVIRHPIEGSAAEMAESSDIPVINAGDGPGQHPSQALLDVYTILRERGKIDGLTIALVGDLWFGRTVHSLATLLMHYKVRFILVSPPELRMPNDYLAKLRMRAEEIVVMDNLKKALKQADVCYMTRIQEERFLEHKEYERLKDAYVLTREIIEQVNPNLTVMHPLPRVGEISLNVDGLPGAAYFRQAANGVPVRMALLALVLGKVK